MCSHAHAAVATQGRIHAEPLVAVQSPDVIGQVKGVLMERYKMTNAQAFALLVKTSHDTIIALRQVAD